MKAPMVGDHVLYNLSEQDARAINDRRASTKSLGLLGTFGNSVSTGDVFPMIITRVWGDAPESSVNGQVFLDGTDLLWVTSVAQEGTVPGRESVERMFHYAPQ